MLKFYEKKLNDNFRQDNFIRDKNCVHKMGRSKVVKCAPGRKNGWMDVKGLLTAIKKFYIDYMAVSFTKLMYSRFVV
jgi:hypothetical protein